MAGVKKEKQLWREYVASWYFHGNLCASVPKSPSIIGDWVNSRKPKNKPPEAKDITAINEEVLASMMKYQTDEELEERSWLGFQMNQDQLVVRGSTIRAHLKDCSQVLSSNFVGKVEREWTFSRKIKNGLYVKEYFLPITRFNDQPVTEPDGFTEKAIHVTGPRGVQNALKRFDYVHGVKLQFTLQVASWVHESDLHTLMQYGAIHGYAGERSEGEGRYEYEFHQVGEPGKKSAAA